MVEPAAEVAPPPLAVAVAVMRGSMLAEAVCLVREAGGGTRAGGADLAAGAVAGSRRGGGARPVPGFVVPTTKHDEADAEGGRVTLRLRARMPTTVSTTAVPPPPPPDPAGAGAGRGVGGVGGVGGKVIWAHSLLMSAADCWPPVHASRPNPYVLDPASTCPVQLAKLPRLDTHAMPDLRVRVRVTAVVLPVGLESSLAIVLPGPCCNVSKARYLTCARARAMPCQCLAGKGAAWARTRAPCMPKQWAVLWKDGVDAVVRWPWCDVVMRGNARTPPTWLRG